jgi:hypothetical protein
MPTTKLRLGKGARGSILSKYVHPKPLLSHAFPNGVPGGKLEDVVVQHIGERKVSGKMQDVVWFHHESVKDGDEYVKLCSVRRFLKLTSEGDPELFFEAVEAGAQEPQEDEQQPAALMAILERAADGRFIGNDEYEARHIVQQIDDDNEPAPENLPGGGNDTNRVLDAEFGHNSVCNRKKTGATDASFRFNFIGRDAEAIKAVPSILFIFECFFMKEFIERAIIPADVSTSWLRQAIMVVIKGAIKLGRRPMAVQRLHDTQPILQYNKCFIFYQVPAPCIQRPVLAGSRNACCLEQKYGNPVHTIMDKLS